MMFDSLRGHLLIAGCELRDPNFFKTVVLIVEHTEEGSMGLVINRPSSLSVSNALAGHFDLPDNGETVYCGGPVEPDAFFVLHNVVEHSGGECPVAGGLFVGAGAEEFEQVINRVSADPNVKYRVFSGCAGWGPGQLEQELDRRDWFTHPACEETAFHDDPYALWDLMLRAVYEANRIVPHSTPHPEWN